MEDPDTVEVDEQMEERTLLKVSFEERFGPIDLVKLHEPLGGWDVHKTSLKSQP
jgi:hypothetical protein